MPKICSRSGFILNCWKPQFIKVRSETLQTESLKIMEHSNTWKKHYYIIVAYRNKCVGEQVEDLDLRNGVCLLLKFPFDKRLREENNGQRDYESTSE